MKYQPVVDFLSRPPVTTLTMVLDSCGHETSGWPHLYETDPDFSTTYQMLGAPTQWSLISIFRTGLLCRLGHLCVPSSECKDDLGISLQSGGRTLWHRKDSGNVAETFLLAETSTGCRQVYQVLHHLRYCQTNH
jgi:hypothetical protein